MVALETLSLITTTTNLSQKLHKKFQNLTGESLSLSWFLRKHDVRKRPVKQAHGERPPKRPMVDIERDMKLPFSGGDPGQDRETLGR